MFIVVVARGTDSETTNFCEDHKALESFCASILTENPDELVEVSPVKLAKVQLQTRVELNISQVGSGRGRKPGAMKRDPVTGQLLKADGTPAAAMGRPKGSKNAAPTTSPASQDAATLVRNVGTGETLATSEAH